MKNLRITLVLLFLISTNGLTSASGFLGIGDCKSVNSKVSKLESKVIRDLNYIIGLSGIAPNVNSAQGVRVYEKHLSVKSGLKAIQAAGKSMHKCFNLKQRTALSNPVRWSVKSYIEIAVLSDRYWISSDLKYQPLRDLQ